MIRYKNFSLENVFLMNGYSETDTPEGRIREYTDEDGLEQLLRRIVATRKPTLSGWDLRFLRQGMGLSQAQLGDFIERDAQTIARWEKSKENVPVLADMAIRIRFCGMYEPSFSAKELISLIEGLSAPPSSIYLSFLNGSWSVVEEPRVYVSSVVSEDSEAEVFFVGHRGFPTSRAAKRRLLISQVELLPADESQQVDASLLGAFERHFEGSIPTSSAAAEPKGRSAFSFNISGLTGRA